MTYTDCPACGQAGALSVVTVTARTSRGPRRVGGWSLCLNCEATPEEADRG